MVITTKSAKSFSVDILHITTEKWCVAVNTKGVLEKSVVSEWRNYYESK